MKPSRFGLTLKHFQEFLGPTKEQIWRQTAVDWGAIFIKGTAGKVDRLQALNGCWALTLDTYTLCSATSTMVFTRMRAPYVNCDGFRFSIHQAGIFSGIAKVLGMTSVPVGHKQFDADFVIQATDEDKLRRLLANEKLRALITRQPRIHLTVQDNEGQFGPAFPADVDELHFATTGIIRRPETLRNLFDLFGETLTELSRIGSAKPASSTLAL